MDDKETLKTLELRIKTILPEEYQETYEELEPVSMGSAGLKFGSDGKVAWDEIWESFCDLAMAGGPPHKGSLLEPGLPAEITAQPDLYDQVVTEICRGISLATDLTAQPSPNLGWVRVECENAGMAEWLVRAIVMENVSAYHQDMTIDLPAGPQYRMEKEIKNVITVIAKTCHYWLDHMWQSQQRKIASLFATMAKECPLIQPSLETSPIDSDQYQRLYLKLADIIRSLTGLRCSNQQYMNWIGVECLSVKTAIWIMRGMVVSNVLSRREGTVLFLPLNLSSDPAGQTVAKIFTRVHHFALKQVKN